MSLLKECWVSSCMLRIKNNMLPFDGQWRAVHGGHAGKLAALPCTHKPYLAPKRHTNPILLLGILFRREQFLYIEAMTPDIPKLQ